MDIVQQLLIAIIGAQEKGVQQSKAPDHHDRRLVDIIV
jgi:hypothetical protein